MVRRGCVDVDGGPAVLGRRWSRGRVVHVRRKLGDDVSRRRGDRGRSRGHRRGRGLAVNQVRGTGRLGRVLHRVADGGRGRRGRGIVLLRGHDVVRVGHHRLALVFGVVVSRRRARRGRLASAGARIVLDRDGDEVAVLPGGDAEGVLVDGARGRRRHRHLGGGRPDVLMGLVVMLVGHVLQRRWGRHQEMRLRWEVAQVMLLRRQDEPLRDFRRRRSERRVDGFERRTGHRLAGSHVPVVDVSLQVPLRQVGSLAALHDAAHEQRAAEALLDSLHRLVAAGSEKERKAGLEDTAVTQTKPEGAGESSTYNRSGEQNFRC